MRLKLRALFAVLALSAMLLLAACDPASEETNFNAVNALRASHGLQQLTRTHELNTKAWAQAEAMANRMGIFHSTPEQLTSGIAPGWRQIGENIAETASIERAQTALEGSPPHLANMLHPDYNQVGIGVTIRDGRVFLVQIFMAR